MSITRNFDLYLNAGKTIPLVVNANQYDQGEEWVFTLYSSNGVKYTPSSGSIVGIKADGNLIANAGTVNGSGQVVITETQQMTAAAGKAIFELQIDGDTHGTANFIVLVEPSPTNGGTASTSDISLMEQAIEAAGEIEEIMGGQTVTDVIAPVISDWLEDNMTNPSNPAIDASLTVSGAAADAKVTGDELTDLKNALFNPATEANSEFGSYIQNNGGRAESSSWASLLIAPKFVVIDGEITITAGGINGYSTSIPSYAFFDESMNLLDASYAAYTAPTVIKNIPSGTKWVAFNNGSNPSTGFAIARQSAWTRMDALRSSSDEIIDDLYSSVASVASVSGSYYMADGSKKLSSSWSSLLIDIGKVYVDGRIEILTGGINGYSTSIPSYVIFDESMTALASATAAYSAPRVLLTEIPENARWIAFNTGTSFTIKCRSAFRAISDNDLRIKDLEDITGSYDYTEHEGYLKEDGTYGGGSSYHSYTTKKIACNEGDVFYYKGASTQNACSAIFYKINNILSADHTRNDYQYSEITIPNGCDYVVFSSYAPANSEIPFGVYKKNNLVCGMMDQKFGSFLQEPLTTLPSYIRDNLYYKPLGELKQPYICLVTDDGVAAMNTYTIPMVISKNVPMTFAIMSASQCVNSAANIAIVKDAIENHGCSVAQHGGTEWTNFTEFELNRFFDTEAAFFATNDIPVKGAVIPSHYNSKLISALAGGRFGVVRSGVDGHLEPTIHYDYYTAGARSNLFMLPSYNVKQYDLAGNKAAIDYAIANNKLIIIYIHENDMSADDKTLFEAVIDYAKTQPITFITLGDIIGLT